ncbi:hypothetical protein [uncultured Phycicoccus sp.]|uniref:hypothetical protein n=1 Tax=uncultured Phycicoccus sp. TaxID=661422 RepID=UPI00261E45F4|nr:hypothetical protein [uncultured Phycicoccus sp.]
MFATVCFVALVVWLFAALGRGATPPAERLPWTRWTARDLLGNAVLGGLRLLQLSDRNPMTPHKRTAFHA